MSHDPEVPRRPATTSDVAARAGVSRTVVSVVLNGARGNVRVSPDTRARILAAADELGYLPDLGAQALRRRRSGLIGFVHRPERSSVLEAGISYRLEEHVRRVARRLGFHVIQAAPSEDADDPVPLDLLLARRVEGVIVENPATAEEVAALVDRGLSVVQALRPHFSVDTSTVTVDPRPGIAAAIEHLRGLGHERIAFVSRGGEHPVDAGRRRAFFAAMSDAVDPGHVRLMPDYRAQSGGEAMRALLAAQPPPTALLTSETMALGVLRVLDEAGRRVPADLSLVAYDDVLAADLYPPLTSVVQPLVDVADRAVGLLTERADQPHAGSDPVHVVVPTRCVVRASTASPGTV